MPVIHNTISQFVNGVSQQAPNLRRESQLEDQVNCFSSISDGVLPRPPTEHSALVSSSLVGNAFIHTINRDADERFIVLLKDGEILVYDLDGVEQTVTYPAGTGYLAVTDAKAEFEAFTVKDYTFIVNKSVTVANISRTPGALDGTVQTFANLKDVAKDEVVGVIYEIQGSDIDSYATHYVEKTINGTGADPDTYVEVVDPRVDSIALDATTMPHQLVRTGANTFEFQEIVYLDRAAGDDLTNPMPSFVGQTLNDLFLHRNRLGVTAGDNPILSEAGAENFFNFFRTTVTQLLDSDPIDTSANNTRVSDLKFAVPFGESLLLFSEQTQFELTSEGLLTPRTVEIKPITQFEASVKARPVLAGRNVYFAMERTNFTGIREYFVETDNRGNDAADITKHAPRYIPKDVYKIVPSTNEDTLFFLTEEEPNAIYVYQFFWGQSGQGLSKLQSAWHKWDLGADANILNIDLINNILYVLIEREGETFIESLNLTTRLFETDLLYQIRLDRRSSIAGSYSSGTGKTTWTLPYGTASEVIVVRDGGFSTNAGLQVLGTSQPTTSTVEVVGDFSESECILGIEYTKRFTLSPLFVRTSRQQGGSVSRLGGRLQIRNIKFSYSDSSFFSVEVTPKARSTYTRDFTAPIGAEESVLGSSIPRDGVFSVPVMSRGNDTTITVTSSSFLPFAITSAEWEGFFHSRAR